MEQRRLGRTNVEVPVIGMGTWKTFDVRGTEEEQRRKEIVEAAIEEGAIFFDSSPMYGEAERVLGDALCNYRKDVFLATKIWTAEGRYNADDQIEASLRYFGGVIDLYQVHNLSETELVTRKMEKLREEGKVRFLGITHYVERAFPDILREMRTGRYDTIQIPYNAARTQVTEEILPLAQELDLGVIVMVPLGTGGLVNLPVTPEEIAPFRAFGCETWAQVLLKWIISDTRVHVVIPATSKPDCMRENARAGSGPLFDEEHRALVQDLVAKYSRSQN